MESLTALRSDLAHSDRVEDLEQAQVQRARDAVVALRLLRALADVSEAVSVGVGLVEAVEERTVVALVAKPVPVVIPLTRVGYVGTVVAGPVDPVPVGSPVSLPVPRP